MSGVDWRGIGVFAGITIGVGAVVQLLLLYLGILNPQAPGLFGYTAFVALILLPGAGAVIARQVSPVPADSESRLWPLPAVSTFRIILAIPLIIVLLNVVMVALGWTSLDLGVSELVYAIKKQAVQTFPPDMEPILPVVMLVGGIALSIVMGATLFAAMLFCMEYGWRGYLLPKLLPLGKWPAIILAALAPLLYMLPGLLYVYTTNEGALNDLPQRLLELGAIALGAGMLMGSIWHRSRHLGLVAIAAGTIYGHTLIWDSIFPADYWILTGSTGLVICTGWLLLSFAPQLLVGKNEV